MWYFSHQNPDKCQKCGSTKVVKIIYGETDYKTSPEEEVGKIIHGGCNITGNDPLGRCTNCKTKIFKRKFRTFA